MYASDLKAIDNFYLLSERFGDDLEMVINFIDDYTPKNMKCWKKRSVLKFFVYEAKYGKISKQVEYLLTLHDGVFEFYLIMNGGINGIKIFKN